MKKLLLTFAAALCMILTLNAESYTYTASEIFGGATANTNFKDLPDNTAVVGGFSFKALKNSGSTEPTYNSKYADVRIYAAGTLEIKAAGAKITGVSFEISAAGLKRLTDITPSVGEFAEQGVNPLVWAGSAEAVTFTVGDKAVYGTDGETKAGQLDFSTITITTDGPVGEAQTPTIPYAIYQAATAMSEGSYLIFAEGLIAKPFAGTKAYGYLDSEAVSVKEGKITAMKEYAFEFIAVEGGYNIKDSKGRYLYQTGNYNSFNVSEEIKDDVDPQSYVWAVTLEDGAFMVQNTCVDKVIVYTPGYKTFGSYARTQSSTEVAFPVLYKYVEDTDKEPEAPEVQRTSITRLADLSKCANSEAFTMDVDLTVIYANGSYNYVCDANNGYGMIYKSGLGLEAGQILVKGWTGSISIYNNLIELVPDQALTISGTTVVPSPIELDSEEASTLLVAANQNAYVKLTDVVFAEATPAADANKDEAGNDLREYTGVWGDTEVNFYQRFGVASVPAGTYDVVGFITVYKDRVQINTVAFEGANSKAEIAVENNAAVTYYNMQGVKVANPESGRLYIRVQGNKAEKVVR